MRRLILYLLRWQLSTPILWLVMHKMGASIFATVVANLIGGAVFFWVDRFIFTSAAVEVWHIKERGRCDKCGKTESLWRLVETRDYDRRASRPIFLCCACSKQKLNELKSRGIKPTRVPLPDDCSK